MLCVALVSLCVARDTALVVSMGSEIVCIRFCRYYTLACISRKELGFYRARPGTVIGSICGRNFFKYLLSSTCTEGIL